MNTILEDYQKLDNENFFEEFASEILKKLKALFPETIITHRIKTKDKLEGKLRRKGDKYKSLEDITDIIGFRIVSYRAEDISHIQKMLEHHFKKDDVNSIDKRTHIGSEFGYASLHLILSITQFAPNSIEIQKKYSEYLNKKFEIQVRTILEDAWAESEHDLGYKPELVAGLPLELRRSFARIAALLETADHEFTRLRQDLNAHQIRVAETKDDTDYSSLPINPKDPRGLRQFFFGSKLVSRIEDDIKTKTGLSARTEPGSIYDTDADFMLKYGITTIEQLRTLIEKHENDIITIAITLSGTGYGKTYGTKSLHPSLTRNFLIEYVRKFIVDTMKPINNGEQSV